VLRLRIGRLVLPDTPAAERRRLVAAFERELASLAAARVPRAATATVRAAAPLGRFTLPRGVTPEERGRALAAQVFERLTEQEGLGWGRTV